MKIVIIDYDMGNVKSITNAFKHVCDHEIIISADKAVIEAADGIILPGVGAFRDAMEHLSQRGLIQILEEQVLAKGKPLLGICLGMQLLFEKSTEGCGDGESIEGLGWIPGEIVKLDTASGFRIPHVGWNDLDLRADEPMWDDLPEDKNFYFVHSYYAACDDQYIIAKFDYGRKYTAAVRKDNIIGMQCHPEKSHKNGFKVLCNFVKYMEGRKNAQI